MWTDFVAMARRFYVRSARYKAKLLAYSPRVFGEISIEVLFAIAVPIMIEVFPMTGIIRLILLVLLAFVFSDLASRVTPKVWGKCLAWALAFIATLVVGHGRVSEQFYVDAVIDDYNTQRDLAAKYAAHDATLKSIVEQYDRLRNAQSLFKSLQEASDSQGADINRQNVEDLKNALNDIEAVATPLGDGIRIKLGRNLYRVIFPVPMRITPAVTVTGLPTGSTATLNDVTNLGFTVVFFPLSIPVDHFGLTASAEP